MSMSESRTQKSIKNISTGLLFKLVGIFCPFLIRTLMIQKLGSEYLGLSQLFTSILQVLSLTELGIGNAMVYAMYKPIAEKNDEQVCALLNLYRKLYRIIGIIILIIGLALMPFLKFLISGGYPSDINLYLLYVIYLTNTVLSYFLFAYKKSLLDAQQKISIDNIINSAVSFGMYLCQIIALYITANYYVYIIFLPISTLVLNLVRGYIVSKKYPQYICTGSISKEQTKELYSKVKALIGNKIGSIVIWFSDSIVISAFLGLNTLAVYSNYYYIMNAIIGLMAVVYNSVLASIGNSLVLESKEKNLKDFQTLNMMNAWVVGWCAICLLCLYQPFMKVWMGDELMLSTPRVILFVCYFYFWLFNKIGNAYINAAGLWREEFWKPYVSSAINLVLNIALVQIIGLAGVLISTIFASVFIETTWEGYILFKYYFNISPKHYFVRLMRDAFVAAIFSVVTYVLCFYIKVEGLAALFIRGMICLVVGNLFYLIVYCRTPEFKRVKSIVAQRKLRR